MLLVLKVTLLVAISVCLITGVTRVLFDKNLFCFYGTNTLLLPLLFRVAVGGTSKVSFEDAFWLLVLKVIFLLVSDGSCKINDSILLFFRIWVVSVPTRVRLKLGTVIVLFAVRASVLICAQAVPISESVKNLTSTKLFI